MVKVTINGKTLYSPKGVLLSQLLAESGSRADHPCGGKGICKKCLVTVNGKNELSCQYIVTDDIVVDLGINDIKSYVDAEPNGTLTENMCYMLDIGTSTLALALVSLDSKSIVDVRCCTNSQRMFGADVISRIEYCTKNGVGDLQGCVINDVNKLVIDMAVDGVLPMYAAGNTTMLHIFLGESPVSIGVAPYTPAFLEGITTDGSALGLKGVSCVKTLPCVHSFCGADIVAGVNLVNDNASEKYNILVDLGTNAEIALFNRTKAYFTSAAAGPCFEGVSITCGMSAVPGAINEYSSQGFKTVGNISPKGLCGTGLIDVVATLLSANEIDDNGYLGAEKRFIAPGVYVTRDDVRQYQLAKSAVYSGIIALMKKAEVDFDDIENLYISGGFSAKINVDSCVKTGLLPHKLKDKCKVLNNSSLSGGVKCICNNENLDDIIKKAEYHDLSADNNFSTMFLKNMGF